MKKLFALILAAMMLLTLGLPVMADDTPDPLAGHTYTAYQIFAGTQKGEDASLGSVEWGDGIKASDFLEALKKSDSLKTIFADCNSAAEVAAKMTDWADNSDNAKVFAKVAYANKSEKGIECKADTTLAAGYYLVVDTTVPDTDATDFVYNLALLQLTNKGNFEIRNKTDLPTVQKKVKDINDTTGTETGWQDSADYDIGDTIPYQLTGTVPSTLGDYDTYYYEFVDTFTKGLTYQKDAKVYINNGTERKEITEKCTITPANAEEAYDYVEQLSVKIDDLKKIDGVNADSTIVVEYTCILNDNAVIGSKGNPNTVYLNYSNNPNESGKGKTKPDTVIVFTYQVEVTKIDGNNNPLNGAGFTLYKKNAKGEYAAVSDEIKNDQTNIFTWKGLDDGDYKIVETTVPAGYNKAADTEFTISAEHDVLADEPVLKSFNGDNIETGMANECKLAMTVVNNAGTVLPETGGAGTTMLLSIGAAMFAAASIILVTKKRQYNEG
ncbi:MAG: isopeptide-forming domain-containing fimbrial protein [Clostridia bacterium]|nr:isopeptide-forming domain-containing fimbrial protein [Clostridia bacterium]